MNLYKAHIGGDTVVKFIIGIFFVLILNGCSSLELFIMDQKAIARGNRINNYNRFPHNIPRDFNCNASVIIIRSSPQFYGISPTINRNSFRANYHINCSQHHHNKRNN